MGAPGYLDLEREAGGPFPAPARTTRERRVGVATQRLIGYRICVQ